MVMKRIKAKQQGRWKLRWNEALKEVAIIGAIFLTYRISSGILNHGFDQASQNTYDIVNLEKSLGIFLESDFQSFFINSAVLTNLINIIYTIFYYPALITFTIWAFIYHRQQYFLVRNVFLLSATIAFTCFALYPVAPPWMFPKLGFTDTMAEYGLVQYESGIMSSLTNLYAAMPSCHFAWTLLIGTAIVFMTRFWWLKMVGVILPLCMLISIIATANHFFLDALGGVVVVGLAYGILKLISAFMNRETELALD